MATLYLDRSGLELREDGDSLAVYENGERRRSVPLLLLERVVIQGNVRLSSRLLARLAGRDVGLVVIGRRHGAARVSATWLGGGDAGRRLAQYRAYCDENWRRVGPVISPSISWPFNAGCCYRRPLSVLRSGTPCSRRRRLWPGWQLGCEVRRRWSVPR
jgi:hypothetical protein